MIRDIDPVTRRLSVLPYQAPSNARAPGRQFVTCIGALKANPGDGDTRKETMAGVKAITGPESQCAFVACRGHDYHHPLRMFRSGQKCGFTPRTRAA